MQHDVDALAALDEIDAVPDNGRDGAVKCRPPCTVDTKGCAAQDGEANMVGGSSAAVEGHDDGNENLASRGAGDRFPHAQAQSLSGRSGIPVANSGNSTEPEGEVCPVCPSPVGESQGSQVIIVEGEFLALDVLGTGSCQVEFLAKCPHCRDSSRADLGVFKSSACSVALNGGHVKVQRTGGWRHRRCPPYPGFHVAMHTSSLYLPSPS